MDEKLKRFTLGIMETQQDLTLATLREDGYPRTNTVSYASDGLIIYFGTGRESQKIKNIQYSDRVSLVIDTPYEDWSKIKGLSMAGTAEILIDSSEVSHAMERLGKKFPQATEWVKPEDLAATAFVKITPKVISVLNYELGFGHTDLVFV